MELTHKTNGIKKKKTETETETGTETGTETERKRQTGNGHKYLQPSKHLLKLSTR